MARPRRQISYKPILPGTTLLAFVTTNLTEFPIPYLLVAQQAPAVNLLRGSFRSRRAARKAQELALLTNGDVSFVCWYNKQAKKWYYENYGVAPI